MPSYRVLVVDDNHEVRRMITASIKTLGAGIDVLDVPSAEEALFIGASLPLDLVVLDYRLPGMTGLDMVKRLRKRKPDMKIILVTGVEDETSRQQVAKANVAAYFFKPIEIATFLHAVKQCLWVEQSKMSASSAASPPAPGPGVSAAPAAKGEDPVVKSEAPAVKSKAGPPKIETPAVKAETLPVKSVPHATKSEGPANSAKGAVAGGASPALPTVGGGFQPETLRIDSNPKHRDFNDARTNSVSDTGPAVIVVKPPTTSLFTPTFGERLAALKEQVSAISVFLVNEMGQIVEKAGPARELGMNSSLLPALMDTFRASQRVADAFGKHETESLSSFTFGKQHIYLTPVDPSNVLLVFATGYVEPDKLGMLDRAIHLAARDLHALLEKAQEAEKLKQDSVEPVQTELPADVVVDQATLAGVMDMFSKVSEVAIKDEADGFWETPGEESALDQGSSKDALSYEEARNLGLGLDEAHGS